MKPKNSLQFFNPKPLRPHYPLLIYLPGMDGTGELLHRQIQKLAQVFDLRCLRIPTHDMSNWATLGEKVVQVIKKELEQKASLVSESSSPSILEKTVYLCGESFGGCLALEMAIRMPELFRKIILVNPASCFNQRPVLGWGVQITRWMPEFLHQRSTLGLLPFLAALERIAPSDRRALLNAMKSVPPHIVSWRLSMLRDFMVNPQDLKRLSQPVLLISSGGDRLLPSVAEAERLAGYLSQSRMVILPHSGHACLLEADIDLYEIMKSHNFLETEAVKKYYQDLSLK